MQDGSPALTARSVTKWFKNCGVDNLKKWPGNSPDHNPIENVWYIIKKQLQSSEVSTVAKLKIEIQHICDNRTTYTYKTRQDVSRHVWRKSYSLKENRLASKVCNEPFKGI